MRDLRLAAHHHRHRGIGAIITAHPNTVTVAKIGGGAAFLFCYGAMAARRALKSAGMAPAQNGSTRLLSVLLTCLAMTFLNPHVYLDTVVLLGTLANQHAESRWLFGIGAVTASVVWFFSLGSARAGWPGCSPLR